jgi:aspartyl/asparaginyl beta-hydroxylase (cupin superfamily)
VTGSEEERIDAQLAREPRNIAALVRKGALRFAAGDDRAASAFFEAALREAQAAQPLAAALRPVIERAQAGIAALAGRYARHLEDRLAQAGFPTGRRPPRFQHSLDLMQGRRSATLQLQRPKSYYFPDLPQRAYYERTEFPWAGAIEAAAPAIREEILAYLAQGGDGFAPYLASDATRPRHEVHGLTDNPAWSTLYLTGQGRFLDEMAGPFARTIAAVSALDLPHIGLRAPSILFSRLLPGARIPPHHGMINARLICHLPLVVPPGCGFRVADQVREWREGELLIFDDSIEHEAWNESASDRILLIFDIWRPELDEAERRAVAALFEAVDAYGA